MTRRLPGYGPMLLIVDDVVIIIFDSIGREIGASAFVLRSSAPTANADRRRKPDRSHSHLRAHPFVIAGLPAVASLHRYHPPERQPLSSSSDPYVWRLLCGIID